MAGKQTSIELTPLMVVNGAIELLSDKAAWTTNAFAKDSSGAPCKPYSNEATCYCLIGALRKIAGVEQPGVVIAVIYSIRKVIKRDDVGHWNDEHSYRDVMHVLKQTKEELLNV